jgi:hypothetical protein
MKVKTCELPRRKTDGASQFIGNSLQNFVVLESLTFPPRAGVLVPKTQMFLFSQGETPKAMRHLPIQLGFRLRHWWSRPNNYIRKFWRCLAKLLLFSQGETLKAMGRPLGASLSMKGEDRTLRFVIHERICFC